mgnify:CR=1 FL=1
MDNYEYLAHRHLELQRFNEQPYATLSIYTVCDDAYDLKRKSRHLKNSSNHLDNAENRRTSFIWLSIKLVFKKKYRDLKFL